jgi:hypothetical protein
MPRSLISEALSLREVATRATLAPRRAIAGLGRSAITLSAKIHLTCEQCRERLAVVLPSKVLSELIDRELLRARGDSAAGVVIDW